MGKNHKEKYYVMPQPKAVKYDNDELLVYGNEIISREEASYAARDYSRLFGANKNLYRVIPSIQDGMKPSLRRLLWSWWLSEGKPQNIKPETLRKLKFYKGGILSTHSMEYHPHSDSGISEMLGRMGQDFSNNIMYIVKQGSFGNLERSEAAAGRYITAKLSEFTIDCFFTDFDKYCVPMKPAYDGEKFEPEYLPSKYPAILFNPQFSGIGYGLASNIPSFNPQEVMEATIKLIRNPKQKILLLPDIPTGADVLDEGQFDEINETGKGKITMQATSEIDFVENTIRFTSIPLTLKTNDVISKIIELQKEKHMFEEIYSIENHTKKGDVDMLFRLKKEANPEKILKKLYTKNTGLRVTFPVGIVVIDDYEEKEYGIRKLLLEWIDYRKDDLRAMLLNSLQQVMEKQHMNNVLLMVFSEDNIDDTIKIAKSSNSRKETIEKLIKRFKITSLQAGTIADMRVYNFNKDSYERYKEEKKKLKEEISTINNILNKESNLEEYIIEQLKEGIKKYGSPRRSKIIKVDDEGEDNIPNIDYLIGITENGYIKKVTIDKKNVGVVGKERSNLTVSLINNRENLILVDSKGNVCKVSISAIPEMNYDDIGLEIKKFFPIDGNVVAIMELPSMKALDVKREDWTILFVTKKGLGKKVLLSDFKKLTGIKSGIKLDPDDEVATAIFTINESAKDVIISTNQGNGIRLPINEFRTYGTMAKGLPMLILKEDEYVVKASKVTPKKNYFFYITSEGKMKLTEVKLFPTMKRLNETTHLIQLSNKEVLVGISCVGEQDSVMLFKQKSEPETILVKDIPVKSRMSKGEKLIKMDRSDSIVSYKVFMK